MLNQVFWWWGSRPEIAYDKQSKDRARELKQKGDSRAEDALHDPIFRCRFLLKLAIEMFNKMLNAFGERVFLI